MRVFVTGATGFVGSAVVQDLLSAGHQVTGLARSEQGVAALEKAGAAPHRGHLEDLDSLRRGAENADGVIHCGFIHDFSKFVENCEIDRRAIDAMSGVLAGSDRTLVVTSGTALVSGQIATEDLRKDPKTSRNPRLSEEAADAAVERGTRACIVRLPPSVHGDNDHGFIPILINLAREKGEAAYVGDGQNRWPGVARTSAATLFRLALEKGKAGARYHGNSEIGVSFKSIAEVIGRRLGLPVTSKTGDAAQEYFTWFSHFAAIDNPTSNAWTRAELGWEPTGPDLLTDIDRPIYFGG
ncbi:MAG: SDR family oxidoreductase [Neorhizobium sp.]|nr:SDR family oxidoreductase [Neorhizobium sp.]